MDSNDTDTSEISITVEAVTDPIEDGDEEISIQEDRELTRGTLFANLRDYDSESHSITKITINTNTYAPNSDISLNEGVLHINSNGGV